ncbi:hypothetical protein JVU11DRAFT_233 [Chiua virens]|nr:hypothetical protein JVU11DRAFT_233 [Chiua virens]
MRHLLPPCVVTAPNHADKNASPVAAALTWFYQLLNLLVVFWVAVLAAEVKLLKDRIAMVERIPPPVHDQEAEVLTQRLHQLCERIASQEAQIASLATAHKKALEELNNKIDEQKKAYDTAFGNIAIGFEVDTTRDPARPQSELASPDSELNMAKMTVPVPRDASSSIRVTKEAPNVQNSTRVPQLTNKDSNLATGIPSAASNSTQYSTNLKVPNNNTMPRKAKTVKEAAAKGLGLGKENTTNGNKMATGRYMQKAHSGAGQFSVVGSKTARAGPKGVQSGTVLPSKISAASQHPKSMLPAPRISLVPTLADRATASTQVVQTKQAKTIKAARTDASPAGNRPSTSPVPTPVEQESSVTLPTSTSLAALDAALAMRQVLEDDDLFKTRLPCLDSTGHDMSFTFAVPTPTKIEMSNASIQTLQRNEDVLAPVKSTKTVEPEVEICVPLAASSSLAALDAVLQTMGNEENLLTCTPGPLYYRTRKTGKTRPPLVMEQVNDTRFPPSSSLAALDAALQSVDDNILTCTPGPLYRRTRRTTRKMGVNDTELPASSSLATLNGALQSVDGNILTCTPGPHYRVMDDSFPTRSKAPTFPRARLPLEEYVNVSPMSTSTVKPSRRL